MSEPELRWAPHQPAPRRAGRVWLIIGLAILALAIVGALLFVLVPRGAQPSASPTPTNTGTPTSTPSPTPTAAPTPSSTPTVEPTTDPQIDAFRGQVSGLLAASPRGLDIVGKAGGQDALPVIDSLQQDLQRLSEAQPPASIEAAWRDDLDWYDQSLTALRSAVSAGTGVPDALTAARAAVADLRSLVGL